MNKKILIIDDHAMLREGLKAMFSSWHTPMIVSEAINARGALEVLSSQQDIDLILLDLGLPDVEGYDFLETLVRKYPYIPVAILSITEKASVVGKVLQLGAKGYIPKSSDPEVLESAIKIILAGSIYIPPTLLDLTGEGDMVLPVLNELVLSSPIYRALTKRQMDIVKLLVQGMTNKEIGSQLNMSPATVRSHLTIIFRQLNVKNRTEAVNVVRNEGLITL